MKCSRKQIPLMEKTKSNNGCYRVGMLNDVYTLFWE